MTSDFRDVVEAIRASAPPPPRRLVLLALLLRIQPNERK